jgi:hypothetical protein
MNGEIFCSRVFVLKMVEEDLTMDSGIAIGRPKEVSLRYNGDHKTIWAAFPTPFDNKEKSIVITIEGSPDKITVNSPLGFEEWLAKRGTTICGRSVPPPSNSQNVALYDKYLRRFYNRGGQAVKVFVKGHKKEKVKG